MLRLLNDADLKVGIVGNVQYRVANGQLDHAGVYLSEGGGFLHLQQEMLPQHSYGKVLAVKGACLLMRRNLFEEVRGLDTRYINGCEDINLCYKVRSKELNILVFNERQIRHHVSLSRARDSSQNERNSRVSFAKWRKEIKQDLAGVWLLLIRNRTGWDANTLSGSLSEYFLASPFSAARIIAESVLTRLEAYWARTLRDEPLFAQDSHVAIRGVKRVTGIHYDKVTDGLEIDMVGLNSARNVYVCGIKVALNVAREFLVSFEVKGIQTIAKRL